MPKTFLHDLKSLTKHNLKLLYWLYTSNSMINNSNGEFYQQVEENDFSIQCILQIDLVRNA